jgi:hypothetical protein
MEIHIRIGLEETEPPAGRLRVLPESGQPPWAQPPGAQAGEGVGFVGWLGLLRALEAAIGSPEDRPSGAA